MVKFKEEKNKRYGDVMPLDPVERAVFSLNLERCGSKYLGYVLVTVGGSWARRWR